MILVQLVSRAQRSTKRSAVVRCRPGIAINSEQMSAELAKTPDQRSTAPLRYALHRIRGTSILHAQYLFAIGNSSAGNSVMTRQPLSVTTTSSSMRAAEKPSVAGQ
jgi:hypothetical protein